MWMITTLVGCDVVEWMMEEGLAMSIDRWNQ